jgi:DNA/RNA endonuclease G (NUC1)
MKLLKLIFFTFLLVGCSPEEIVAQELREEVIIENAVFKVWYSEVLEQPVKLTYTSTNRPKNVDRGNMDFHKENGVHTSDKHDYYSNPWDKGHLAPAATYSDSYNNLYTTFSYLNCTLQQQDLNRGAWRLLEQEERVWDDEQNLTITIENIFEEGHEVLPTGGHIPTTMVKTIYFDDDGTCRKFVFPNEKPTKPWNEYEVECEVETQGKARKKSLL